MHDFFDQIENLSIILVLILGLYPAIQDGQALSYSWRSFFILSFLGHGLLLFLFGRGDLALVSTLVISLTTLSSLLIMLRPNSIGAGDLLFLGILAYALPWEHFIIILVLSCMLGLCYYLAATMWWKDSFEGAMPFVSILWITTLGVEGLSWFAI